jgi:hypothetical protein
MKTDMFDSINLNYNFYMILKTVYIEKKPKTRKELFDAFMASSLAKNFDPAWVEIKIERL